MRGPVVQLLLSGGCLLALCFLFPILEILEVFFYFTIIPVMFFVAIGLIGDGTWTAIQEGWSAFFLTGLRQKVQYYRQKLGSDEPLERGTP